MAGLLDYLEGIGETGATLGTGLLSGVVGAPYGLYKGITSGYYGSPEAVRIAEREAKKFMERNTYVPRGKVAQEALGKAAQLMEASKLPPIIPEAIALGSIPRQAYLAQAERRGMDLERAMAPRVERMLERGGAGADILQGMSRGTVSPLDVYHGSPHRFPPTARNPLGEFDASKIGTGEGAQVYGYGLYTAEAPVVAKEYQRQLGTQMKYKGQEFYDPIVGRKTGTTGNTELDDYLLSYLGDTDVIRKELLTAAREMRAANNPQALKEYQALMGELRKVRPDITAANTGSLYKVDLPDEQIAKMLDFDKPLNQQSEYIKNIIKEYELDYVPPNATGGRLIEELNKAFDPATVSMHLRNAGIPGIKYLDKNSRQPGTASMTQAQLDARIDILKKDIDSGLGDQNRMKEILSSLEKERALHKNLTRNFVIFPGEEKSMRILERNGFSGLLAE